MLKQIERSVERRLEVNKASALKMDSVIDIPTMEKLKSNSVL